jgi:alpha-L-fucosidase
MPLLRRASQDEAMTEQISPDLFLSDEQKTWFRHDRFGMFVHWGLYALAARHKWVKNREEIDDAGYQKYFDNFDPDLYDPKEWARRHARPG